MILQAVQPAMPIIRGIAADWRLVATLVVLVISSGGYVAWCRMDDARKGINPL